MSEPFAATMADSSAHQTPQTSTADAPSLEALKQRLADSDARAFEQIFRRLSKPVFRYVGGMVEHDHLAHDITQDTFAKLWSIRERADEIDALRPYVLQMARNQVYNQYKSEQVHHDHQTEVRRQTLKTAHRPAPDEAVERDDLAASIEQWLEELPDRQREALVLCRQEGLSHDEIARIMQISPSTVNNHIVRALRTLRSRIEEQRPDLID